jgi:hypothetical protein
MTLQTALLFVFGSVALIARVFLAVRYPYPTPDQQSVFRTVLALAAAGIAGVIPGMFDLKSNVASVTLSATGTLAVFAFVYLLGPKLVLSAPPRKKQSFSASQEPSAPARSEDVLRQEVARLREQVTTLEKIIGDQRGLEPSLPVTPVVSKTTAWLITTAVVLGVVLYFIVVLVSPTPHQYFVVRLLLALLAATVGALLPGTLASASGWRRTALRWVASFVLFVIVYFFSPTRI